MGPPIFQLFCPIFQTGPTVVLILLVHSSGVFPLLFKKVVNVIAGPLSTVFCSMIRLGSFPSIWRTAHITPVPKGISSSSPSDYRPISITSILSKVYERMIASRVGKYLEINGLLPTSQYGFRKILGTCNALLHVPHTR